MKSLLLLFRYFLYIFRVLEIFFLLFIFYLIISVLYFRTTYDSMSLEDAFLYSVFWWSDHTTYADGFDEEKFSVIEIGMNEKKVLEILGQPLQIISDCNDKEKQCLTTLHYTSQSPYCCSIYGNDNHHRRYVQISPTGIVLKKGSEFYLD